VPPSNSTASPPASPAFGEETSSSAMVAGCSIVVVRWSVWSSRAGLSSYLHAMIIQVHNTWFFFRQLEVSSDQYHSIINSDTFGYFFFRTVGTNDGTKQSKRPAPLTECVSDQSV
jgi:hypothetical protein